MPRKPQHQLTEARVRQLIDQALNRGLRSAFSSALADQLATTAPIEIKNPNSPNASVGLSYDSNDLGVDGSGQLNIVKFIATVLDELEDVNVPTPNDDEALTWDAALQQWVPKAIQVINFDEADFGIFILWSFVPSGAIDGVNDTFSLPAELEPDHVLVAKNGLVQTPTSDFTIDNNNFSITFVAGNIPQTGDNIVAMMEQPPNPAELVFNEVPTGAVDGINNVFTLSETVIDARILLTKNGLVQRPGDDYTWSPAQQEITFLSGNLPQTGDKLLVTYEKEPEEE